MKTYSELLESMDIQSLDEARQGDLFPDDDNLPKKKIEKTVDHGFDLTGFGDEKNFKKVLSAVGLSGTGQHKTAPYPHFVWENDDIEIVTGNNPITGEYARKGGRDKEKGYASYIGITGNKSAVRKAVSTIKKHAEFIKDESKGKRDFI